MKIKGKAKDFFLKKSGSPFNYWLYCNVNEKRKQKSPTQKFKKEGNPRVITTCHLCFLH